MTRGLRRPWSVPESWRGHRTRLQDSAGDVRVSGRGPVPDITTRPLRGNSLNSIIRGGGRPRSSAGVLHPDEEERRTLDLEVIQTDGEREARAQPASAMGEADWDLDGDALPAVPARMILRGASRGSFTPVAMPLTVQYGCSTS